jgi:hypothetical protein
MTWSGHAGAKTEYVCSEFAESVVGWMAVEQGKKTGLFLFGSACNRVGNNDPARTGLVPVLVRSCGLTEPATQKKQRSGFTKSGSASNPRCFILTEGYVSGFRTTDVGHGRLYELGTLGRQNRHLSPQYCCDHDSTKLHQNPQASPNVALDHWRGGTDSGVTDHINERNCMCNQ